MPCRGKQTNCLPIIPIPSLSCTCFFNFSLNDFSNNIFHVFSPLLQDPRIMQALGVLIGIDNLGEQGMHPLKSI